MSAFGKKGNAGGFFKKGSNILHSAVKGLATVADEPLFATALGAVAPSALPAYTAVKASGVLQKLKH